MLVEQLQKEQEQERVHAEQQLHRDGEDAGLAKEGPRSTGPDRDPEHKERQRRATAASVGQRVGERLQLLVRALGKRPQEDERARVGQAGKLHGGRGEQRGRVAHENSGEEEPVPVDER